MQETQSFSQEEVCLKKVNQAYNLIKKPVIVNDTGIFIKKYNNFPGVFTKYVVDGMKNDILKIFEDGDEAIQKCTIC